MKLTVLGNNGTYPQENGACSSYLITEGRYTLLIDMGNGSLAKLQHVCDVGAINAIVLSHLHFDHFADIIPLRYALETRRSKGIPIQPVHVYVPSAPSWLMKELSANDVFILHRIHDRFSVAEGPFSLFFRKVKHSIASYAVRVAHGSEVFVYSSDTAMCNSLLSIARDADLLLCEASYIGRDLGQEGHHLSARLAGRVASVAQVGRLLLTHLPNDHDPAVVVREAAQEFPNVQATDLHATYPIKKLQRT
ncbi:MAG: MBL fold metallo-hydrolase [Sphaerochaeta sp.]|nr:MBL fold metallo-hydrolase [Sphaerochaeta sp.]